MFMFNDVLDLDWNLFEISILQGQIKFLVLNCNMVDFAIQTEIFV